MSDLGCAHARVWPDRATAGSLGTWVVEVSSTLDLGPQSYVRVQFPRSWHAGSLASPKNSTKTVHSIDRSGTNYVGVRCDQGDVKINWHVEGGTLHEDNTTFRHGIDGDSHRWNYVVCATVAEGTLHAGLPMNFIFGDRTYGSPGFEAGIVAANQETISIECVQFSHGVAIPLAVPQHPLITIAPNMARKLKVTLPSTAKVGQSLNARFVFLDDFNNQAAAPEESIRVDVRWGDDTDAPFEFGLLTTSAKESVELVASRSDTMRVRISCGRLTSVSNPVHIQSGTHSLFWGDLHSHAGRSVDAIGDTPFEYARDIAHLDFYSLTEHSEGWRNATPWKEILNENERYNAPGSFATIPGYECTLGPPYGHHNVYFRAHPPDWPLIDRNNGGTLAELWDACRNGDALTVPHHTGVVFPRQGSLPPRLRGPLVDWKIHNEIFRRLAEVYSSHGQSELYAPDDDLAYERVIDWSTENHSSPGPHYIRDAWMIDARLGVIASSDNHEGMPGMSPFGLVAVWADELSRESVFQALYARRVYATTGERMVMQVTANKHPMGSILKRTGNVEVGCTVIATDTIAHVSLIRGDLDKRTYSCLRRVIPDPNSTRCNLVWADADPPANCLYMVIADQTRLVDGRRPRAWSSPIWILS